VDDRKKARSIFPLRLGKPLKEGARHLAAQEGVSLNHFISLAVAEKIGRLEGLAARKASSSSIEQAPSELDRQDS
jgi:HicB family